MPPLVDRVGKAVRVALERRLPAGRFARCQRATASCLAPAVRLAALLCKSSMLTGSYKIVSCWTLQSASMRGPVIVALFLVTTSAAGQYNLDRCRPSLNGGMAVSLSSRDEPGQRLIISGVVRDQAGVPVPNAFVRAFQADVRGIYTAARDERPRLCGVARTDSAGRYRFVTIKPASYPNTREPAHVHFEIWAVAVDLQRARLEFEGDPYVKRSASSRTSTIRSLQRDGEGTLRCERDLVVKRHQT